MNKSKIKKFIKKIYYKSCEKIWFLRCIAETEGSGAPITLKNIITQKIFGFNRSAYWPVHKNSRVTGIKWIKIGEHTAPGASFGCYIFAAENAEIKIGAYTTMAPNVCIAGFNHNIYNIHEYVSKGGIDIGKYCWLGMNSTVLSGVKLGDHTVVAANSVVTKSFPDGYCVLAGNPAKIVKIIDRKDVREYIHPYKYVGYRKIRE